MKITEEQIQKLMAYTHATAEQAAAALKKADGDLLNALHLLLGEQTKEERPHSAGDDPPAPTFVGRLVEFLRFLWRFLVENRLEAYRPGTERKIECPLAALLALLVIAWYAVIFFVVLGLAFGWKFRFCGTDLGGGGAT
jgi:hypothetical protein